MKSSTMVMLMSLLLGVSGCKSTFDGAVKALDNLTGGTPHDSFEGKYLAQSTLDEYKNRDDELSGEGNVISYSGLSIPSNQLRKSHVVDAPMLSAYLRDIVDALLMQWDGTPVTTQVQVINSQHFAPYADPYGMISVPLGMLNNVESEDEVAQLLAHELSHLLLRHHERFSTMDENSENVSTVAEAFIFANMVKDTKVTKDIEGMPDITYRPSSQGQSNINKAMRYNSIIEKLSDSVWNTAWQRTQEDEADLLGMDLAVAAGYAPRAGAYTLQRLSDFQGKQQGLLSKFWENEAAAITQSIAELDLSSLSQQADSFLDRGAEALTGSLINYFERSHMSPDDRDDNLRDYVRREYQSSARQRPKPGRLNTVLDDNSVQNVLKGYQYAFAAAAALAENEVEEAEALALKAINEDTRHHTGIREVLYNVRMAQGYTAKARQNLDLVRGWQHASPNFLKTKVEVELQKENYLAALDTIKLAETSFGNRSFFIIEKAVTLANLDRKDEAVKTLQQCLEYQEEADNCKVILDQYKQVS